MEIKRTTEIFVETNRRFVVHPESLESTEQIFCSECAALMLSAEQIAVLLGISRRSVYKIVENGATHFTETGNGFLFGCPNTFAEILVKTGDNYENI